MTDQSTNKWWEGMNAKHIDYGEIIDTDGNMVRPAGAREAARAIKALRYARMRGVIPIFAWGDDIYLARVRMPENVKTRAEWRAIVAYGLREFRRLMR
ncbi:MAG: hypothetical protein WD534_11510 [Phycisphaeraceae bacterium]